MYTSEVSLLFRKGDRVMSPDLSCLYELTANLKEHRKYRHPVREDLASAYAAAGLPPEERVIRRFEYLCRTETPVIFPGERICFLRTSENLPDLFTPEEWDSIRENHYIHELGFHSNLCADYEKILQHGLLAFRTDTNARSIDALLALTERYRQEALKKGREDIASVLSRVPAYGARTLREAMQSFRILSFALWLEGNYHNNIGRLDKFMGPYMESDIENGLLTEQEAFDLLCEFFLTFNRDSDLYPGVQQGDNGQSMMLGALPDRENGFSRFSMLCLKASHELKLIDPKINVRVNKDTPDDIFTSCSELTKAGLGFPQYSNDDVVIPGLEALGYSPEDASDYTVAACWEYIIPGVGGDIPNICALSFPGIVDTCLHRDLPGCKTMTDFLGCIKEEIRRKCDELTDIRNVWFVPSPMLSTMMDYENGVPRYRNFGMHGVGASTAVDSLTAIEKYVFDEETVSAAELIAAVDEDFANAPELLHKLRFETPKLGCDSDRADALLEWLLGTFSDELAGRRNEYGGIWRAGTGSAMYYLWSADEIGASPDGRRRGEPFAANYSVSLFAKPEGPFSVLASMTAPDLKKVINGGPLTLEFHQSMFNTPEAVYQVGQFVKRFITLGGHQLQLNAVNAETLKDAKAHPEKYPHLIVRIWGWSAYFTELEEAYQDHVIRRQEYCL